MEKVIEKTVTKKGFTCSVCFRGFLDFRNGGHIKNMKVYCPACGGKPFQVNVNGNIIEMPFNDAMKALKELVK